MGSLILQKKDEKILEKFWSELIKVGKEISGEIKPSNKMNALH